MPSVMMYLGCCALCDDVPSVMAPVQWDDVRSDGVSKVMVWCPV